MNKYNTIYNKNKDKYKELINLIDININNYITRNKAKRLIIEMLLNK